MRLNIFTKAIWRWAASQAKAGINTIASAPLAICLIGFAGTTRGAGQNLMPKPEAAYARAGGYQFDGTISRPVLENYLGRSITMEGLLNGRGDLKDNIRMLKSAGAKYIGRALCLWGAEADFLHNIERAREEIPQVLAADPEIILEACVFETISPRVNRIA